MIVVAVACASKLSASYAPHPQIDLSGALEEEVDSARAAYVDSIVNLAAQSYKDVLLLYSEGEDYSVIYPAMYDCYELNMKALKEVDPETPEWAQIRGTLIQIDPDLEKGAFYYSSLNNTDELSKWAQAFIDVQLLPEMRGVSFKRNDGAFPTIIYSAASRAFNAQEWDRAIEYFKLYFSTGDEQFRERIYLFMGNACYNAKQYDLGVVTLLDGLKAYPLNRNIMMSGIQTCVDGGHAESLQEFLTPALMLEPNNEQLLNLQGQLYEDEGRYQLALDTYAKLDEVSPNKLSVAKHIALCHFNMGVVHFNDAINSSEEKLQRKNRRQAKESFYAASQKLEEVIGSDPMAVKYLKALGISYLCLEEKEKFEGINRKLQALGVDPLSEAFSMQTPIGYSEEGAFNLGRNDAMASLSSSSVPAYNAPKFSEYGQNYVTDRLKKWSQRNTYEKTDEYLNRVNSATILAEYNRLLAETKDKYIEEFGKQLILKDLKLMPYDPDNETYLIQSSYGPITVHVPIKNNEAELFKTSWENMKFQTPTFVINDEQVQIASVTIVAPYGKNYKFNDAKSANYSQAEIYIDFNQILGDTKPSTKPTTSGSAKGAEKLVVTVKSDVDENIPVTNKTAPKTFALVIANENYENVSQVPSALHDGERFAEYCTKVMGIPENNVTLMSNASLANMRRAIRNLTNTVNAFDGEAEVVFYYAGHGVPDDATKDAYLLPIDGDAQGVADTGYSLDRLYKELGNLNSTSIMVFLDACFSGSNRDGSMLNQARGVSIAPKETGPSGNMYILSAASGTETAMPYKEKNHGLFTYFLLKKMQESKGNVSLKDLADYVITNVKQYSNTVNSKPQTPTVNTSGAMKANWTKKKVCP